MLKIRRPLGRLIFNMGITIPCKTVFLIEMAPWYLSDVWKKKTFASCNLHYYMVLIYIITYQGTVTNLTNDFWYLWNSYLVLWSAWFPQVQLDQNSGFFRNFPQPASFSLPRCVNQYSPHLWNHIHKSIYRPWPGLVTENISPLWLRGQSSGQLSV